MHHRRKTVWRICAGSIARQTQFAKQAPRFVRRHTLKETGDCVYQSQRAGCCPPEAAAQSKAVAADARARAAVQRSKARARRSTAARAHAPGEAPAPLQASKTGPASPVASAAPAPTRSSPLRAKFGVRLREGGERQRSRHRVALAARVLQNMKISATWGRVTRIASVLKPSLSLGFRGAHSLQAGRRRHAGPPG